MKVIDINGIHYVSTNIVCFWQKEDRIYIQTTAHQYIDDDSDVDIMRFESKEQAEDMIKRMCALINR